jgi:hypothetical protein
VITERKIEKLKDLDNRSEIKMPEEVSTMNQNGYLSANGSVKLRKNDNSFSSLGSSPPRTSSPTFSGMEA